MKSCLYITGKTVEGALLIGGVYKLKDQEGMPLDVAHDSLSGKGFIDFAEYLAAAGAQNKYDSALADIKNLLGQDEAKKINKQFSLWWGIRRGNDEIDWPTACQKLLNEKIAQGKVFTHNLQREI